MRSQNDNEGELLLRLFNQHLRGTLVKQAIDAIRPDIEAQVEQVMRELRPKIEAHVHPMRQELVLLLSIGGEPGRKIE